MLNLKFPSDDCSEDLTIIFWYQQLILVLSSTALTIQHMIPSLTYNTESIVQYTPIITIPLGSEESIDYPD